LLDELRRAPGTSGLSPDEIRARLGAMILGAVEQRQAVGGAA
jgi:hypothetical protein